jgi:DNA-binding transcriptional LysR family regulator
VLPPVVAQLHRRHPRIRPRIHDMLPEDVERFTADGELDLGFLPRPPARPDLVAVHARTTPLLIVSAPGPKRPWSELSWIVPRFFKRDTGISLDNWPDDRFPRQIVAEVEMLSTAIQFAEAGVGVGFLPELAIKDRLAAGRLAVVAEPPEPVEEHLWIVWRKRVRPRPAAREVLAALGVWKEPAR